MLSMSIDLDAEADGRSSWTPKKIRILATKVEIDDNLQKAIMKLGPRFTKKPEECTHLVANTLARTEKFLCALPQVPQIITSKWLQACASAKKIVAEREYYLNDPTAEKKHGFKLSEALARAKVLKQKKKRLLENHFFYFTPKVPTDHELLQNVIDALGAKCKMTSTPTARNLSATRHLISCPEDAAVWRPLASDFPIYTSELLLSAGFRQYIQWEDDEMRVPGSY
ncbi:hypothetical protein M422DRAFT_269778 [Sphaerobolus stellatus SS14]|uniref:BRCT domain-containing protein n=1 Tax=Sphaerobolus stellatus (strain SS14) TaxID=990650 RepID=A0A0C9THE5_SPHS4|nr:hypothetical protein M422DRAFT_269778 [Sphaerobolus stellatus SS14]